MTTQISPQAIAVEVVGDDEEKKPYLVEFESYATKLLELLNDETLSFAERKHKIMRLGFGYVNGLAEPKKTVIQDGIGQIYDLLMKK